MKHVIDNDDYEIVITKLKQLVSLSRLLSCERSDDADKNNIFWLIKDLAQYSKDIIDDAEVILD